MEMVLERVLRPDMVWVLIPLAAIFVFGIKSILKSLRRSDDVAEWQAELLRLRARVDELERAQGRLSHADPQMAGRNS